MSDTPKNRFELDLDNMEREGTTEPFQVRLGGEEYTFIDPMELDWRELEKALTADLRDFFPYVLGAEQSTKFLENTIPTWKMRKVMEAYSVHFGLVEPGNSAASSQR